MKKWAEARCSPYPLEKEQKNVGALWKVEHYINSFFTKLERFCYTAMT